MRYLKIAITFIYLCASLLHAETIVGQVVAVSDGDTIKVLDDSKKLFVIRLMGIDAPEKAQPFGQRAKQSLSELVFQRRVEVQWNKRDRYDRVVGKVLLSDSTDACLEQIGRGMAWHYKQYASEQMIEDRLKYSRAEQTARSAHEGLWAEDHATPPWMWRRVSANGHGRTKDGVAR